MSAKLNQNQPRLYIYRNIPMCYKRHKHIFIAVYNIKFRPKALIKSKFGKKKQFKIFWRD